MRVYFSLESEFVIFFDGKLSLGMWAHDFLFVWSLTLWTDWLLANDYFEISFTSRLPTWVREFIATPPCVAHSLIAQTI